jgi:hypothetical protein
MFNGSCWWVWSAGSTGSAPSPARLDGNRDILNSKMAAPPPPSKPLAWCAAFCKDEKGEERPYQPPCAGPLSQKWPCAGEREKPLLQQLAFGGRRPPCWVRRRGLHKASLFPQCLTMAKRNYLFSRRLSRRPSPGWPVSMWLRRGTLSGPLPQCLLLPSS